MKSLFEFIEEVRSGFPALIDFLGALIIVSLTLLVVAFIALTA